MNKYAAAEKTIEMPAFLGEICVSMGCYALIRTCKSVRICMKKMDVAYHNNPLTRLSPSASPMIAKQVAVNQKVRRAIRL
jgi:hypothetical protein